MLMAGQTPEITKGTPPLLNKLVMLMKTTLMQPKVIVEYDRVPYIYPLGNVRVTLDENIRGIIFVRRWYSMKWVHKSFVQA